MSPTRMTPADPGPFRLRHGTGDLATAAAALTGELPARPLAEVLAKANRQTTRKGKTTAFGTMSPPPADWYRFQPGDDDTADWYPQGVAGSSEAGRTDVRALAVSWYWKPVGAAGERGVRISLVDLAGGRYRHVLLVHPEAGGSYRPVNVHAGGIAWYGDLLYVADTARGLRVFDLRAILEVDGDDDRIGRQGGKHHAFGYRYVLPQMDAWTSSGDARFSFLSIDRTTTPHSLVSGEYVDPAADPGRTGRVARWPLSAGGTLLAGAGGEAPATETLAMPAAKIQGALCLDGTWYLSQAASASRNGALLVARPGKAVQRRGFPVGPEDLTHWAGGRIWSVTEFRGRRALFAVPA
ncbi:hypothetical protein Sru01_53390 [Sphaerisporangium rufum]|uniref:Secreted protein n=1 Tax=Sphaerisporangium rufum TaxID=1381558 RepID=A0A919R628_9ACTN|nr:hypothetical protein [Sphaerisporangium rufum]GII80357.1 hypothetical protein Sru01_53390 [Sphaerisporangium rufum]